MMKLGMAVAVCALATAAFAEEPGTPDSAAGTKGTRIKSDAKATPDAKPDAAGGMMGWHPRKVTHEDKKGIDELFKRAEEAMKTGDSAALVALHDFPLYMVTDDSQGNVMTEIWTEEKWNTEMSEAMKNMPKDMKVKHDRKYDFLTDDIAIVHENNSTTMGKQKMSWKGANLVILKDGKWLVKSEMEGGWGDMAKAKGTGGSSTETK